MDVCFYFQLHQPKRVRRYQVFDIGSGSGYFDEGKNGDTLRGVSERCYVPAVEILTRLAKEEGARVSMSLSGVLVEQMERHAPRALTGIQALVQSGGAELLSETSHHSLSSLRSADEFADQVRLHRDIMKRVFGVVPKVFRNTELIVNDALTPVVADLGFDAMMVEGADAILGWRSPNYVYASKSAPSLRLLARNYRLSDDVAFRFTARDWSEWPLTADKYAAWIAANPGDVVNVFMDFETLGEHQHADSGIFDFLRALPAAFKRSGVRMVTPSDLAKRKAVAQLSFPAAMSWADTERDVSAWLGNGLQHAAHERLYSLREAVLATGNAELIKTWKELSTSDHFYYMSTKWHADGDVHTYFSPYATPYDAYISFMNVMRDMDQRVGLLTGRRTSVGRRADDLLVRPTAPDPKPKATAKSSNGGPKAQGPRSKARVPAKSKAKPKAAKRKK
jgi:alpha-amylase